MIGHRASGIGHRASGIGHRASGIGHRALLKSLLIKLVYRTFHTSPLLFINTALFLIILFLFCFKVSALTTQTVKAINGNKPEFIDIENASKKQGFKVLETFYSESSNNIKGEEIKEFDNNLKFSDFKVALLDLDVQSNYQDADGDKIREAQPFKTKTTYAWQDNEGKEIKEDKAETIIGCGSGYSMPLTLTIKTLVNTYSEHGIPNESDSVELIKSYKIAAKSELCYAKPNSTIVYPQAQWLSYNSDGSGEDWNDINRTNRHVVHGGGFTADYVPDMGFKAKPTVSRLTFPTSGFPGAKFQLVMTGAQSDYRFIIINNPGGQARIDENQGFVTLKGKPTGPITVQATLIRDPKVIHQYTFNPTSFIWLEPQGTNYVTFDDAKNICGGIQNLPTLSMFTNSPQNNIDKNIDWHYFPNTFTRAIGQGLFAEWGYTDYNAYPDSDWGKFIQAKDGKAYYWTSNDHYNENVMFVGDARAGNVNAYPKYFPLLVACKR